MDEKRYVTLGDGTVYLIDDDLAGYAVTDRDELMRQDVIPDYDTLDGIVATGETAFTRGAPPRRGTCYTDAYEYYLNDGGSYEPLDSGKVEGLVDTLNALDRSDYATYTADEASLAGYGLDAPALTFTVTTTLDGTQESHALAFGQDGDGNHYLRMDDSPSSTAWRPTPTPTMWRRPGTTPCAPTRCWPSTGIRWRASTSPSTIPSTPR